MASIFKRFTNDNGKYLVDKIKELLNLKQDKLTKGEGIDIDDNHVISSTIINDTLETGTKNTYSISKLKSMIGSPLRYVTNKPTVQDVENVEHKVSGDVYSVTENQTTYAFDSDLNLVPIGTTDVEISGFYTKEEVDDLLEEKENAFSVGEGLDNSTTDTSGKTIIKSNIIKDDASETEEKKTYSVKKINDTYVKKVNSPKILYGTDKDNNETTLEYSTIQDANKIVQRDDNKEIHVMNKPTASTAAISSNSMVYLRNFTSAYGNDGTTSRYVSFKADGKPAYKGSVADSAFAANSMSLSQGYDESSGISFDGDKIVMWSPCDDGCIKYYDEDDGSIAFKIGSKGEYRASERRTVFTSVNGRWTIQSQQAQIIGNFVMVRAAFIISQNENFNGSQNLKICSINSQCTPCDDVTVLTFSSRNNAWSNGNPFTAFVMPDGLYIRNTDISGRTLGSSNWYYISGVYPLATSLI